MSDTSETDVSTNMFKTDEIPTSSTATAIRELEDFIDKSFCSAFERSNFPEPTNVSTPFQQDPEGNVGKLETQF